MRRDIFTPCSFQAAGDLWSIAQAQPTLQHTVVNQLKELNKGLRLLCQGRALHVLLNVIELGLCVSSRWLVLRKAGL